MPRSKTDSDAVAGFLESIDPTTATVENIEDLAEIARITDRIARDEDALREAVRAARAQGRSWNRIAIALGVSRQAARQRFVDFG